MFCVVNKRQGNSIKNTTVKHHFELFMTAYLRPKEIFTARIILYQKPSQNGLK